jgi:hypothetical protein
MDPPTELKAPTIPGIRFGMVAVRERDGLLVGAGAAVALVVLLVLQSSLGSGLLSVRTVTTAPYGYEQVAGAYSSHLVDLDSKNITALVEGYERNATVEWVQPLSNEGNYRFGLTGNYTGWGELQIVLQAYLVRSLENFSMSDESQSMSLTNDGSSWLVDSAFHFSAYTSILGDINATVVAQDWYSQAFTQPALGTHAAGSWVISREVWNFTSYNVQYRVP